MGKPIKTLWIYKDVRSLFFTERMKCKLPSKFTFFGLCALLTVAKNEFTFEAKNSAHIAARSLNSDWQCCQEIPYSVLTTGSLFRIPSFFLKKSVEKYSFGGWELTVEKRAYNRSNSLWTPPIQIFGGAGHIQGSGKMKSGNCILSLLPCRLKEIAKKKEKPFWSFAVHECVKRSVD